MEMDKSFTEYTNKELEDWIKRHIHVWLDRNNSMELTNSDRNFTVAIAEIQRRYIKTQDLTNKELIWLTRVLVVLTIVLTVIAGLQIYKSFIEEGSCYLKYKVRVSGIENMGGEK